MYFGAVQARLLQRVRELIQAGQLTERGLARATGLSQPHVHHILKGARGLTVDFADRLLRYLNLTIPDLLEEPYAAVPEASHSFQPVPMLRGAAGPLCFPFRQERYDGIYPFLRKQVAGLTNPIVLTLQNGDIVLLDRAEQIRLRTDPRSLYAVETSQGTAIHHIHASGRSLYLHAPQAPANPPTWQHISLTGRNPLEVVRGRVVWIGRALPTPKV